MKRNNAYPSLDFFAKRLVPPGAAWMLKVTRGAASVQSIKTDRAE
jgi:hypothetical protein